MLWVRSAICLSWDGRGEGLAHWPGIFFVLGISNHRDGRPYQIVRLSYLIRRLLQASLRRVDPAVALVDVFLHIPHVVELEAVFLLVGRGFVLGFQRLAVDLGAGAEVLFRVCEEVVRAGAR